MAKLTPDSSMKTTAMSWIAALSKKPILASCVENPPIATVENECEIASNTDIPATQ